MASKITDLAALTTPASGDLLEAVDVSDTSMAGTGTNKKMALSTLMVGQQPLVGSAIQQSSVSATGVPGVSITAAGAGVSLLINSGYHSPMVVTTALTITQLEARVTTLASGKSVRFAIYNADSQWMPTTLVSDLGTVSVNANARVTITSLSVALPVGFYVVRMQTEAACSLEAHNGDTPYWSNHGVAQNNPLSYYRTDVTWAAAESTATRTGLIGLYTGLGVHMWATFLWS